MMTELEFKSLAAQGYNRIPLIAEAFADLETPLSLYLKLVGGATHGFLLESVVGGERFGRYSFIGLPARTVLRAHQGVVEVITDGEVVERHETNPLDFIAQYQQRFRVALRPGLPRFCCPLPRPPLLPLPSPVPFRSLSLSLSLPLPLPPPIPPANRATSGPNDQPSSEAKQPANKPPT